MEDDAHRDQIRTADMDKDKPTLPKESKAKAKFIITPILELTLKA